MLKKFMVLALSSAFAVSAFAANERMHSPDKLVDNAVMDAKLVALEAQRMVALDVFLGAQHLVRVTDGYPQDNRDVKEVVAAHVRAKKETLQMVADYAERQGHVATNEPQFSTYLVNTLSTPGYSVESVMDAYKRATGADLPENVATVFAAKYAKAIVSAAGDEKMWAAQVARALNDYNGTDHVTANYLVAEIEMAMEKSALPNMGFQISSFNLSDEAIGDALARNNDAQISLHKGVFGLRGKKIGDKFGEAVERNKTRLGADGNPIKEMVAQLSALEDIGATNEVLLVYAALGEDQALQRPSGGRGSVSELSRLSKP